MLDYIPRDIPGFKGYQVDGRGRIWSQKRKRYLKPWMGANGYLKTGLRRDGKTNFRYIHRIVAKVFLPPPTKGQEINHKDGDKQNNHWTNLEWVSRTENMKHLHERDPSACKRVPVIITCMTCGSVHYHPTITSAAEAIGVSRQSIRNCLLGAQKHTKGYRVKEVKNENQTT